MKSSRQHGSQWERVAESQLNRRGLKTLERNFQVRAGEIDLVMLDGDTLVFTEVRYRKNSLHGSGADSVTRAKQQRLIRAARLYLQRYAPINPPACRFDVVSIGAENGRTVINWIQNAFEAG